MVAVIHHAQPGMRAELGDALQPLFAEGIGATADGPVVVPHLIGSQRHGIAPRIGQKPRTDAKALLGQCRVELPRQASGEASCSNSAEASLIAPSLIGHGGRFAIRIHLLQHRPE